MMQQLNSARPVLGGIAGNINRLWSVSMIHPKYTQYVFSFFMALLMSCIMSLVITVFNVGAVDGLLLIWLKAWLFAFAVALPTINLVTPLVRRLVGMVIRQDRMA
ncbi:DUF2798 domain-containing protein [Bowmanella denitrificans]